MGIDISEKSKKQESNKPACKIHRDLYLDSMEIVETKVKTVVLRNQGQISTENVSV